MIWAISLDFCGKPFIVEADDLLGACYRKAMTPKKLWTLLSFASPGIHKQEAEVNREELCSHEKHYKARALCNWRQSMSVQIRSGITMFHSTEDYYLNPPPPLL